MITFYPTVSRRELGSTGTYFKHHTVLLVASSFAADEVRKYGKVRGSLPVPVLPNCVTEDYCCEDEITSGNPGIVRERQDKTTSMTYHFWSMYRTIPWVWVPTIQGWTVADYQRHATEMKPLIAEMQAHYGEESYFRVGIGTLCKRASSQMIREVILTVTAILGDVPIHLWGVKKITFKDSIALPECVTSVDSAAFNGMFGRGRNEWKRDYKPDGSSYRQAEWCLQVALPRYIAGLEEALAPIKQAMMF